MQSRWSRDAHWTELTFQLILKKCKLSESGELAVGNIFNF